MGRHNTVAGRMAETAAKKARLFTKLAREIMVAARNGSDTGSNAALRTAVNKARDNSMPKDGIERAIKKGSGELTGVTFEEIMYEGYGPGGSAILVEVLTDNKNRTHPELRRIFQKNAGNLGEMNSVSWMFQKKGVFIIAAQGLSEDKIMEVALDAGAEDLIHEDGYFTIYTDITNFAAVREALLAVQVTFVKTGLEFIPNTEVTLSGEAATQAHSLVETLEEHDDVQNVFANFTEE